jgi:hypothetical protein
MKTKEYTNKKLDKESKADLLSLVAEKLKGRDLFPKKTEEARRFLKNAKFSMPFKIK